MASTRLKFRPRHRQARVVVALAALAACGQQAPPAAVPIEAAPATASTVARDDASDDSIADRVPDATGGEPAPAPAPATEPGDGPAETSEAAGLESCSAVPVATTDVLGDGGPGNLDPIFHGVLLTYAEEYRDVFGGLWIDREALGTIVVAVTDDPAPHRERLAQRRPQPDDVTAVEPPQEITDDRPIGEWGVPFDVVQVDHTETELNAVVMPVSQHLVDAGQPVSGAGLDARLSRVSISASRPITPADVEAITASLAPAFDLELLCLAAEFVDDVPEPIDTSGPLDVIALPDADGGFDADTPARCGGLQFPLSALRDLTPVDEVDDDLRRVLDGWIGGPEGSSWPQDGWSLLFDDGERAVFVSISEDGVASVDAEAGANGWIWAGASAGGQCDVFRSLPDGLGIVEWELDPAFPAPTADATELRVLATEQTCTGGSEMGDRLLGPQIVETDDAVRIAFAAVPLTGDQTCPGNPSTPVAITLDRPLGDREIRDGLLIGPITDLVAR